MLCNLKSGVEEKSVIKKEKPETIYSSLGLYVFNVFCRDIVQCEVGQYHQLCSGPNL